MNKYLIDLQRGSYATSVVILEDKYNELNPTLVMSAEIDDKYLLSSPYKNPVFKDKLDEMSVRNDLVYFIIKDIDKVSIEKQNRYIGVVKDRVVNGYKLPENVIIIFTVKNKEGLKNISKELYHFCIVAI